MIDQFPAGRGTAEPVCANPNRLASGSGAHLKTPQSPVRTSNALSFLEGHVDAGMSW
jgi:hypothetical protein